MPSCVAFSGVVGPCVVWSCQVVVPGPAPSGFVAVIFFMVTAQVPWGVRVLPESVSERRFRRAFFSVLRSVKFGSFFGGRGWSVSMAWISVCVRSFFSVASAVAWFSVFAAAMVRR